LIDQILYDGAPKVKVMGIQE